MQALDERSLVLTCGSFFASTLNRKQKAMNTAIGISLLLDPSMFDITGELISVYL